MGSMSAPPPPEIVSARLSGESSDVMSRIMLRAERLPENPKRAGSNTPESASSANTWLVAVAAYRSAYAAAPLVRPQHQADRAPRLDAELLPQPERFPRDDAADAVVGRAGPDVPRIEMAAEHDDLLGPLAPANLGDDVGRLGVAFAAPLEVEVHAHLAAAGRRPRDPIGVLP